MAYAVTLDRQAAKYIRSIRDANVSKPIVGAVAALKDDPRPNGCEKLSGSVRTYRVRVGDYRIVYDVVDDPPTVNVVQVGHRSQVY